jgi:hypothetical protein
MFGNAFSIPRLFLDGDGGLYGAGHFERLLAGEVSLVNFPGVELGVADDLVVCLSSDHEAAVAVYLLRQISSRETPLSFLIR